jgi:hypothetical protein
MMGDVVMADEIGQRGRSVVGYGRGIQEFVGPVLKRPKGDRIFHIN